MSHKILSRDEILAADDVRRELVEVPEWGGAVYVRSLTGAQRDSFEAAMVQQNGKNVTMNFQNVRARLVAMATVDETGKPLFAENDVKALGKKSAAALSRVFKVAQKLSGLTEEDMKELAKNSASDQSDDSGSD